MDFFLYYTRVKMTCKITKHKKIYYANYNETKNHT